MTLCGLPGLWHHRHPKGFATLQSSFASRSVLTKHNQTTMSIAYLTPIYPMPSSTFIRREIAALEVQGFVVHRFAMRRFDGRLGRRGRSG